jgi:DNA-binding response OmpR family regulator
MAPLDEDPPVANEPARIKVAGLTLHVAGRALLDAEGRDVPLTRAEFALLLAFVRAPGRVLSRDQLLEVVAGRRLEGVMDLLPV